MIRGDTIWLNKCPVEKENKLKKKMMDVSLKNIKYSSYYSK